MSRPRIVIMGGGFGGLNAAKRLGRAHADITLVDRTNHHLFQPLLYQVATATLSPGDIAMPIRSILRKQENTEVLLDEVVGIDFESKIVRVKEAPDLPYDYLIVATGSMNSYFGHKDWSEHADGLKDIEDATRIRSKVLAAFEIAERLADPAGMREWLTFLLVGAGPTGVEMAGAISEIAHHVLKGDFKRIDPRSTKIILIEGGPRVLSTYDPALSNRAMKSLQNLDVDIRLNTMVQSIDENGVITNSGRISGKTIIWSAGVKSTPVAEWLHVEHDKSGRVNVNKDLSVPGREGVFVIGDCAYLAQDGQALPGVAQVAIQQGKFVAANLRRIIEKGEPEKEFRYRDLGSLATIGRSSAVAQFGKVHLSGLVAWVIWLFVHILNLVGFRAKLSVLLQWAWAYFTWNRGARLITRSLPSSNR